MQQTEQSKPTAEDKRELEFQIECIERRIEEKIADKNQQQIESDIKELRRLRRLRN